MIVATLSVLVLAAAPLAVIVGAVGGRRSGDASARWAAAVVAVGWAATAALGVAFLFRPAEVGSSDNGWSGVSIDALAVLMLLLVLGLSALIQLFAVRYLRGDQRQTWFVVTANLVTAFTALMVCAATLVGFGVAWLAAGASLVALLATYRQLPQARLGVRRTAVRFLWGDLGLVAAAAIILAVAGGDVALTDLGGAMAGLPTPVAGLVAVLLVVPALARSSQVPFHGWLPATLAAPTPVSALMHAGVVNAGAILILRFSPAIGASVAAMTIIFCAGLLTVAFASTVRMVKPDVKGRLVYSTMAQMGFMMLACGLGAFAAAVFHLIAHGLFKSALFLGAGSGVAREAKQREWPIRTKTSRAQAATSIMLAVMVPLASIGAARTLLDVELSAASQALQVFVVFTAAVTFGTALWTYFAASTAIIGSLSIIALAFGYTALINVFDSILVFGPTPAAVNAWWLVLPAAVLLALQLVQRIRPASRTGHRLYAFALAVGTPVARLKRHLIPAIEGASS